MVGLDAMLRRWAQDLLRPFDERLRNIEQLLRNGPSTNTSEFLTVNEVARCSSVSVGTVRRWIREGKLASCQAGRSLRVKRCDLELFMSRSAPKVEGVIDFKARASQIVGND